MKRLVHAGIGLEIASQLLDLGDSVVLCSRSIEQLQQENASIKVFVDAGKAFLISADVSTVGMSSPPHDRLKQTASLESHSQI